MILVSGGVVVAVALYLLAVWARGSVTVERVGSCEGCRRADASGLVESVSGVYALCGRCAEEVPALFR